MISGFKKDNKNKIIFAKDKKQVYLMIFTLVIFIASLFYMFNKMGIFQANSSTSGNSQKVTIEIQDENNSKNLNANAYNANTSEEGIEIYQKSQAVKNQVANELGDNDMISDAYYAQSSKTEPTRKRVMVTVEENGNTLNPFLPTSNIGDNPNFQKISSLSVPPAFLTPPPIETGVNKDAQRISSTGVSGIVYDEYSPSAIVSLDGIDFLVKKGDTINGYKILDITKDKVYLKLNKNTFYAGVGELLQKADLDFNKNISNLNSKFGGNTVVTISAKKNK